MSWIKKWWMRAIWTVRDVGEEHGKNGYPNELTFVEIPLYELKPIDELPPHITATKDSYGRVVRLNRGSGQG